MKFKVAFPFIPDMGSVSPMIVGSSYMESKRKQALWQLNSMRAHDGLKPMSRLPSGCVWSKA